MDRSAQLELWYCDESCVVGYGSTGSAVSERLQKDAGNPDDDKVCKTL
jgi:hypothetical protein